MRLAARERREWLSSAFRGDRRSRPLGDAISRIPAESGVQPSDHVHVHVHVKLPSRQDAQPQVASIGSKTQQGARRHNRFRGRVVKISTIEMEVAFPPQNDKRRRPNARFSARHFLGHEFLGGRANGRVSTPPTPSATTAHSIHTEQTYERNRGPTGIVAILNTNTILTS